MPMLKRLWLLVLLGVSPVVQASLLTAWEQALAHDAEFRIAQADRDVSAEELPLARAALLPQVGVQASLGRADSSVTQRNLLGREVRSEQYYDTENWSLQIRQPLFRYRAITAYQQGKLRRESAEDLLASARQALALRLVETASQLADAQAEARYANVELVASGRLVEQSARQRGAGAITKTDEARAALRQAQAAIGVSRAHATNTLAEVAWQRMTGSVVAPRILLAPDLPRQLLPGQPPTEELVRQATEQNPILRAAIGERDIARAELRKARGDRLPTVDLILARSRSESDVESTIGSRFVTNRVVVQTAVPLFTGGALSAAVRQAEARLAKAEASVRATGEQIRQVITQEADGLKYAHDLLDGARSSAAAAELARRSAELGLSGGTSTLSDLTAAESAVAAADRDQVRACALALVSWARIQQAMGTLNETALRQIEALAPFE